MPVASGADWTQGAADEHPDAQTKPGDGGHAMKTLLATCVLAIGLSAAAALAQPPASTGPYKVLKTVKAGGDGGFDYVYADAANRRLYVPRSGPMARVSVFNLDSLEPVGEIAGVSGHGAAVDAKSGHGFASSKPLAMWDAKTLVSLKPIEVQGGPDGILGDPASQRIYVLSHGAPNVTVINAVDGAVVGTIDIGGAPEQAVADGKGHLYIDLEDKDQVAVVDTKTMTKTGAYGLEGKCGTPAGLAFDVKNHVLFVACRNPATMTMLNSDSGKILAILPIGAGVDGAVFNPATREAFSSQGDGTLTVVKELSPTSFVVEQTVQTQVSAKTLTLDAKTNHVLLIAAEYGPAPAASPAAPGAPPPRPRRGPMLPGSFAILVVGK
jgi:DNA-binding beta-propeller fold protein YncE